MKNRLKGWLFFTGVFMTVCVWRFWPGMFLVFLYALGETAVRGRRSFCYDTCPIGNALDFAGDGEGGRPRRAPAKARQAGWLFFVLYWAAIILILILHWESSAMKWTWYFRMMAGSMLLALLAEFLFSKRFWCVYMCPLSKLMNGVLRLRRRSGR